MSLNLMKYALSWGGLLTEGGKVDNSTLEKAESQVGCHDVLNFQFTSGTTGQPKAVMLTHL